MKIIIGIFGMITLAVMCSITVVIFDEFFQAIAKIISGDDEKRKGK